MNEGNGGGLPTAGADPGARAPAPGSLHLVQALVNTLNAEYARDLLGTPVEAARWLGAAGLLPGAAAHPGAALPGGTALTGAQHAALLELREAIRQVLSGHIDQRED